MHILRRMSKHLKAISLGGMALAAVGAIGWGVWHFRESRTMKTDDCRVEASIVSVGSKLAGASPAWMWRKGNRPPRADACPSGQPHHAGAPDGRAFPRQADAGQA